ncbi:MAG: LUD domain-containing protein [Verrucomicrobiae bacterium]
MNEREIILGRIREAIRTLAPIPGDHPISERDAAAHIPEWLPRVGESFEDRLALFRTNAADLKAAFVLLDSPELLYAKLREIAAAEGWKKVASHASGLTDPACAALGLPVLLTDSGFSPHDMESCDAGISACDALIAQTGSVLVTSQSAGGRALSVLPPHHVVLASRDQLLPDLPSAFALLKTKYAPAYPSLISFITGPSRTGDIERILVLGAHGPKKLTILCA